MSPYFSGSRSVDTYAKMTPIILVHGGAGDVPDERVPAKISGVKESARIGYEILKNGGTALDAVEAAVRYMEDGEAFNAGEGDKFKLSTINSKCIFYLIIIL